jgi:alginate O-acetyltransferase complex protein AlgJ
MSKERQNIAAGFFFLLFLVGAIYISCSAITSDANTSSTPSMNNIINGKWASEYETIFNESLPTYEKNRSIWSFILYKLYKVGKSGVIVGDNGWLFTDEELAFNKNHEKNIQSNTDYVIGVQHNLKQANIGLIISVIPAKARTYEEHLGRYIFPSYNRDVYYDFIKALKDNSAVTADLHWMMQKKKKDFPLFLKTDTHWTQAGAKVSARTIYSTYKKHLSDAVVWGKGQYTTTSTGKTPHIGDLQSFIPVGGFINKTDLEHDMLNNLESENTAEETSDLDLFGDSAPAITLVGTSYSANRKWGFEQSLKELFQSDILNAADNGLGPFKTMEKYLSNEAFNNNPPKLIIWEIPERYLSVHQEQKERAI